MRWHRETGRVRSALPPRNSPGQGRLASGRGAVVHAGLGGGMAHLLAGMGQKVPEWDVWRPSLWEKNEKQNI